MGQLIKKRLVINDNILSFEFVNSKKKNESMISFGKYILSADITNRVYLFEVE